VCVYVTLMSDSCDTQVTRNLKTHVTDVRVKPRLGDSATRRHLVLVHSCHTDSVTFGVFFLVFFSFPSSPKIVLGVTKLPSLRQKLGQVLVLVYSGSLPPSKADDK
jgi:hypothetical protein